MATSPTTIQLDAETAHAITVYAQTLGLTVEECLRPHVATTNGTDDGTDANQWLRDLDELAAASDDAAVLPADFSTRDIYLDHD